MRNSPSTRRRGLGRFRVSDDYRVPFPDLKTIPGRATYTITPRGRVYRDDGLLLLPNPDTLKVKLNRGRVKRSLPAAMFAAFGKTQPPSSLYAPWVSPTTPLDELTGRRSCATRYVKLVHHGDLLRLAAGTITVKQIKKLKIR